MIIRFLLYCLLLSSFAFVHGEEHWRKEERLVCQIARRENVPIVAVFLGGRECPWSQKLTEDVIDHPLFLERMNEEAILWKITGDHQAKALEQKYAIAEYPQIVLLDPNGKEFSRFGYLPLNASEYLEVIFSTIEHFQEICLALEQNENDFQEAQWIELYQKAQKLSASYFKQILLNRGLKKEKGTFFHLERYAAALERYKWKHPELQKLKNELLKKDPRNLFGTYFKAALLEFQRLKGKSRIEKGLKPLLEYVQRFKGKDPENLWKAEMAIGEFLLERKSYFEAIEHMKAALVIAPEEMKPQIAETLSLIAMY